MFSEKNRRKLIMAFDEFVEAMDPLKIMASAEAMDPLKIMASMRIIAEVKEKEEAKLRTTIEHLDFPDFGKILSHSQATLADIPEEISCIRKIIEQMRRERPSLSWIQKVAPSDSFISQHFVPGLLVADGIWVSSGSAVDDYARLIPPVLIGKNCQIGSASLIGPYSAVANHEIDASLVIMSSIGISW